MQKQPAITKKLINSLILMQIAMRSIAHNRVENVFHVAADLVFAPCFGRDVQQRITRCGITRTAGKRAFAALQSLVFGAGCLRGFVALGVHIGNFV